MQTAIGSLPSVWMMRDDGTARETVVPTGAGNPHWDADGKRLLVVRHDPGREMDLAWVDLASRRLTPSGLIVRDMGTPRLSPDGKALAFHHIEKDGVMNVWTRVSTDARQGATDP